MSPKFRQEDGFVFKIYSNEEERMHIHVVKAENEAKLAEIAALVEQQAIENEKALIEAQTRQTDINTILNVAVNIGDEKALEAICAIMEWDYDELSSQLEKLNEAQKTDKAQSILNDVVVNDEQPSEVSAASIPK